MVDLKTHLAKAREAAAAAWAEKSKKKQKAQMAPALKASRAYWDSMTKKQRSAEMKRRAAKRRKNRKNK